MEMISNASIYSNNLPVHDQELSQYARRELKASPAVLMKGRHGSNSTPTGRCPTCHGPVRRAGMWLTHGLMVLIS
ncbi:MAG: hypothetical protein ISF22_08540 [Methanomassiliicoccus sp.]|nr:hypothetical protein [Methanomassiliicoccus sp.]